MVQKTTPAEAPEILNTEKAAALLKCHPSTLRRLRAKGEGPPCIKFGAAVQYRSDLLDGTSPLKGLQSYWPPVGVADQADPAVLASEQDPNERLLSEFMTGIVWCAQKRIHVGFWVLSVSGPGPIARQVYYALDQLGPSFGPSEIAFVEERMGKALARARPGEIEEVRRIFREAGVPKLRSI